MRIVVPFPAGGTADAIPRLIGDWLSRKWGQPVVIENKAGAAGNIGAEAVANAEPDGYTLLSSPPPPLVVNQNLYPKLGFDPSVFVPISVMAVVPTALVVNPARVAANTVPDFIAMARANPGKITAATQGNGTTSHLTSEMFQMLAKVKFVQVPYRGSAPALQGLVAGDVDIMFDNLGVSLALVQSHQLKLIAVGTERRMASLPDVPTIAETLPGFVSSAWFAVVAPPRTPQRDRRQDQRRYRRRFASTRDRGAIEGSVRRGRRRHERGCGEVHARGGGALARRDRRGRHQARIARSYFGRSRPKATWRPPPIGDNHIPPGGGHCEGPMSALETTQRFGWR